MTILVKENIISLNDSEIRDTLYMLLKNVIRS